MREITGEGAWSIHLSSKLRLLSRPAWLYAEEAQALAALHHHARHHLRLSLLLPQARYLALAETPYHHLRLWQVVAGIQDLRFRLERLLHTAEDAVDLSERLWPWLQQLEQAARGVSAQLPLAALRLDNIGLAEGMPVYLGVLDEGEEDPATPPNPADFSAWLHGQLAAPLQSALAEKNIAGAALLDLLAAHLDNLPEMGEALLEVCLASNLEHG